MDENNNIFQYCEVPYTGTISSDYCGVNMANYMTFPEKSQYSISLFEPNCFCGTSMYLLPSFRSSDHTPRDAILFGDVRSSESIPKKSFIPSDESTQGANAEIVSNNSSTIPLLFKKIIAKEFRLLKF